MRTPNTTYNLAAITPPSANAGCGGIDLYMGGFSFVNKEQFVAMLKISAQMHWDMALN